MRDIAGSTTDQTRRIRQVCPANLIEIPMNISRSCAYSVSPLTLCLLNAHSIKSKSADFIDLAINTKADLMALTETWLTVDDAAARREIIPSGFKLMDQPRIGRRGGGIGLVYRENINIKKVKGKEEKSFEFAEFIIKSTTFTTRLVIIYRPPYSAKHPVTARAFVNEFTVYLESIILSVEPLLIVGDFNLHVDDPHDPIAADFLDTLESMNLQQHVHGPTHELDHTLDLVITRQSDTVLLQQPTVGRFFSDHAVVICSLNSARPCLRTKFHSYRKLKSVDVDALKIDLSESSVCKKNIADLDGLVGCYYPRSRIAMLLCIKVLL